MSWKRYKCCKNMDLMVLYWMAWLTQYWCKSKMNSHHLIFAQSLFFTSSPLLTRSFPSESSLELNNTATINTRFWLVGSRSIYPKLYRYQSQWHACLCGSFAKERNYFTENFGKKGWENRVTKPKYSIIAWLHFSNPL